MLGQQILLGAFTVSTVIAGVTGGIAIAATAKNRVYREYMDEVDKYMNHMNKITANCTLLNVLNIKKWKETDIDRSRVDMLSKLIEEGKETDSCPVFVHFKNGLYAVLEIAENTETADYQVVYREESTGKVWTRNLEMFISEVDKDKYPDCPFTHRFMPASEWKEVIEKNPEAMYYGKGATWYDGYKHRDESEQLVGETQLSK